MVGLQSVAQERAADGAANHHGDNRVPGMARFGQRQLVCAGRFIHADNLFQLARPVPRRVDNQHQRTLLARRFVFIHRQRAVDRQRHFIALFETDYPGVNHRKTRVEGHGVVGDHRAGFAVDPRAADDRAGAVVVAGEVKLLKGVFGKTAFIDNQVDGCAPLTE